jgi:hypothetical protein
MALELLLGRLLLVVAVLTFMRLMRVHLLRSQAQLVQMQ